MIGWDAAEGQPILRPVETSSPIHAAVPIIAYCAGCDLSGEVDSQRRLGRRFICPNCPKHVAAIVKGEPGKFWLRIEARILQYELFYLGFILGPLARYKAPLMTLLRFLLTATALVISGYGLAWRIASCALAILVVFDVLINATAVAFISRFPTHVLRNIFMLFISLALTASAFGALYASTGLAFNNGSRLAKFDAVYFSFVTITTVGYGDVTLPLKWRMLGPLESMTGVLMCGISASLLFAIATRLVGRAPSAGPAP